MKYNIMEYQYSVADSNDGKTMKIFDGNKVENLTLDDLIKDKEYLETRIALRDTQITKARELGLKTQAELTEESEEEPEEEAPAEEDVEEEDVDEEEV